MLAANVPSITDWMQGWGSIFSLIVSTGALIFTGWLLRHEIRVRREERADTEATQARMVICRITSWHGSDGKISFEGPIHGLAWEITNYSGAPIFDATVTLKFGLTDPAAFVDLWGSVTEKVDRGVITLDPPILVEFGQVFDARELVAEVSFTDAGGLRWTRVSGEGPVRVIPSLPSGWQRWRWKWLGRRNKLGAAPPF